MRARLAPAELEARLLVQPLPDVHVEPGRHRLLGCARQLRERADPGAGELLDLRPPNPGDAAEVVDRVPVRVADRLELADRAVRDGIRLRRRRVGNELLEPGADAPVVRGELLRAERRLLAGAEEDVDPLRLVPLDPRELLVVEEELEDVRGLGRAGELRVERLVGAVGLPEQEVGDAAPAFAREDALVDDIRFASEDRVRGRLRGALVVAARILDLQHRQAFGPEAVEVGALVLEPLAEDQLGLLVLDLGPLELPTRMGERERRQVLAGEEGRDVGRREVEPVGGDVHPGRVAEAAAVAYGQPSVDAYARRRTCSTTASAIASTPRRGTVTTAVELPAFV